MKKHTLSATARNMTGRKVKKLRLQGLIPGSIYGKKVKSISVSVKVDEFAEVYKEAGESGLVELTLNKDIHPVLIHKVQREPVLGTSIHVEFYQVDLKEKVQTKVPVEFVGEPLAVTNKVGILMTIRDEVEVEALPADLPEKLAINVSGLAEVDAEVRVKDLKTPSGVEILTDVELTLVKIGALVTKAAEAEEAAEAAAKAAAAAEAAPAAEEVAEGKEGATEEKVPAEEKKEESQQSKSHL